MGKLQERGEGGGAVLGKLQEYRGKTEAGKITGGGGGGGGRLQKKWGNYKSTGEITGAQRKLHEQGKVQDHR